MRLKMVIFPIFLFVLILFTYSNLFLTFYQQDEWRILGLLKADGLKALFPLFSPLSLIGGGGRLLSQPIHYIFYSLFPFQVAPFFIFAIIFHFLNSLLVFWIVKRLTYNKFLSIISSIFFATSSVSQQSVTWIAAMVQTTASGFFILLSILLYIYFIENGKKKFLYFSITTALISYFFKESSIFLFAVLPIIYLIFKKRISFFKLAKIHWPLVLYGIVAVATRILDLILNARGVASFVTSDTHYWQKFLSHLFFYPLESLSQIFIYPSVMWYISEVFIKVNYQRLASSEIFPVIGETIAADLASITFSLLILCILFLIYLKTREYRKIIIFSLLFIFLSFLPFAVLNKGNAYLDSRYFYNGIFGGAIIFALFINYIKDLLQNFKLNYKYTYALLLLFSFLFFFSQVRFIQKDINSQVLISTERKNFLSSVKNLYPKLPDNPIIYITGDSTFYAPNHRVPLQQGPGFTFMVLYYDTGVVPKELITQNFLWDIQSQGYREVRGRGFGYFWDLQELKKEIKDKGLSKNQVIGLYYNGLTKSLINTTSNIRQQL